MEARVQKSKARLREADLLVERRRAEKAHLISRKLDLARKVEKLTARASTDLVAQAQGGRDSYLATAFADMNADRTYSDASTNSTTTTDSLGQVNGTARASGLDSGTALVTPAGYTSYLFGMHAVDDMSAPVSCERIRILYHCPFPLSADLSVLVYDLTLNALTKLCNLN